MEKCIQAFTQPIVQDRQLDAFMYACTHRGIGNDCEKREEGRLLLPTNDFDILGTYDKLRRVLDGDCRH